MSAMDMMGMTKMIGMMNTTGDDPEPTRPVVIKYGGAAMNDEALRRFAGDVVALAASGVRIVVVHGGGNDVTSLAARLGLKGEFVDGQRRTDPPMMEAVTMALAGTVNTDLVRLLNVAGGNAVGLSGVDGDLLAASRITAPDLGLVGRVERVNVRLLGLLLDEGIIPVIATLGAGENGAIYNINADPAAGAVAAALGAGLLIYMSDVEGVRSADGTLMRRMTPDEARGMIASGSIHGGMIPKVESALAALESGVPMVRIVDGRVPGIMQSLFAEEQGSIPGTAIAAPPFAAPSFATDDGPLTTDQSPTGRPTVSGTIFSWPL